MEIRKKVTPVYDRLKNCTATTVINYGGAGSSKSHSQHQYIIEKLVREKNKKIAITRKTYPSLRRSTYDIFIGLLKEYGIYRESEHNKTFSTYELGTNRVEFFGMDEPEKLKSTNYSYIWMEEANEFTYDDYITLYLRLRHPKSEGEKNQIFLTFNPIDENNWIARQLRYQPDVEIIHSTYKDNPFLDDDYINLLESTIDKDSNYYRVYILGEWGKLENLIYSNWEVVDELPEEYSAFCYGIDFGYVNPTAVIKVLLSDGKIFLDEVVYKEKLTNSDLIERMSHVEKADLYCDRDESQRIEEFSRAGWSAYPGEKDVKMGIDLCARQKLYITKRSDNLLKEIKGYSRKKDRDGNVLEEPLKYMDHTMDAMRFGVYGLVTRFGFATAVPSSTTSINSFSNKKSRIHSFKGSIFV
ncbi:MAG: PBSX family phage terminase large subunit [archaeon]|nr:PBSX family phage terminase large subunit [archaeon]